MIKYLIVLISLLFMITGCSDKIEYKQITQESAYNEMKSNKDIVLIDVRDDFEYNSGYIEGAINIPVTSIENEINSTVSDKNTTIYVYCRTGIRSKIAAETLISLGYKNVYDMGGIESWPYGTIE